MSKGLIEASGRLIVTGGIVGGAAGIGVAGPVGAVVGGVVGAAGAFGIIAIVATTAVVGDTIQKLKK